MEYIMGDIKIYVINDTIFFSTDDKHSVLDQQEELPIHDKTGVDLVDFVNDNGKNTYYSTKFPLGCIFFVSQKGPRTEIGKQISRVYKNFKNQRNGHSKFFRYCAETEITDDELLSLHTDISKGFDRKKAEIRVARKFNPEYVTLPERAIIDELMTIQRERETNSGNASQIPNDMEM